MNGVNVEYEATLKQSAKGVWYCDGIRTGDKSIEGLGAKLHLFMMEIEQTLYRHNYPEPSCTTKGRLVKDDDGSATMLHNQQPEKKEE